MKNRDVLFLCLLLGSSYASACELQRAQQDAAAVLDAADAVAREVLNRLLQEKYKVSLGTYYCDSERDGFLCILQEVLRHTDTGEWFVKFRYPGSSPERDQYRIVSFDELSKKFATKSQSGESNPRFRRASLSSSEK